LEAAEPRYVLQSPGLVENCVGLYVPLLEFNHIEPIVNQLHAEGKNCSDHILSLTTPLMRKHLNPFGKYHFDLNRMRRLSGEIP
jgi:hypothetical protein